MRGTGYTTANQSSYPTVSSISSPGWSQSRISPAPPADQWCATAVSTVPNTVGAGSLGFFLQGCRGLSPRHRSRQQRVVPLPSVTRRKAAGSVGQPATRDVTAPAHPPPPVSGHKATPDCDRGLAGPWPSASPAGPWLVAAVPGSPHRSPPLRLATPPS